MADTLIADRRAQPRDTPDRRSHPRDVFVEFRDVHKAYGPKAVLRGANLNVYRGEVLVILGGSGTGKSVTLRHMLGLEAPDAGRVIVEEEDVTDLPEEEFYRIRKKFGMLFQSGGLFDSMTVAENIALGLVKRGLDPDTVAERTAESLEVVELAGTEDKYPAELSGGMRKRVGIARAIALKPRYILYDEPTSGLDPVTSAVMDQLMVRTRDLGVTGLVVTHDMRSAFCVGDRIAMLHEGRIRQVGTRAELQATSDPVVRQFIEGRP